ncbi:hypothetical protein BJ875DRAFT_521962 [Amylocarpus encephaloides]|uniref:Ent-kaurene synthase n=1 Tax=Amylocarpus encephaloides TaxID=45428 RepID=A0A9P7Y9T7_9HELO|nr:hypothetical protein BJ875DRAFT_521962 [Amylocarpus encephaloides]
MNNHEEAISLIHYCAEAVGNTHTFGHLTSSIYDTAWVAVLRKPGVPGLLFPECYQYILDQQHAGSGWGKSPESEIDGIMSTLGGLFALGRNLDIIQSQIFRGELAIRIQNGAEFLNGKLQTWDVASCDHVGFEIIIPCMLEHLNQQGLTFTFPGKTLLAKLNEKKLGKIHPAVWSGKVQTTITHSLEAFLGKGDFSRLKDQRVLGGMGSSPASTAAYLMSCSEWDDEVETYLRTVLGSRWVGEIGGVPGMYPTTGFEVLWIASTLLEDGFDAESLPGIESLLTIIGEFHGSLDGLASGFSKSSVADADDTAKSIMICNLLRVPTSVDKLVKTFEGKTHFLTYMMERHPSVTTNCNILSAILVSPDPEKFVPQIEKIATYLCGSWKQADIPFQDKWNISEFYPIMLLSQALCRLVEAWDKGKINEISKDLLAEDIALVLLEVLVQTLQKQNANGSWGHIPSKEITAYAIIALGNLASMPFASKMSLVIRDAIEKGRSFINLTGIAPEIEYVWIAKTNYSPIKISRAYILAALETKYPKYFLSPALNNIFKVPIKDMQKYTHVLSNFPTLKGYPPWIIEGSVTQASFFLNRLKTVRLHMFDRQNLKGDEYLEFIAMTLTCANNLHGSFLKTDILFDMMGFILHVYEVDEYFEHVIGRVYEDHLPEIKQRVEWLLDDQWANKTTVSIDASSKKRKREHTSEGGSAASASNGHGSQTPSPVSTDSVYYTTPLGESTKDKRLSETSWAMIAEKIKSFAATVIDNKAVKRADPTDVQLLKTELHKCLISHITQLEDSRCHNQSLENGSEWKVSGGSYYAWTHTTAAAHSCSPLSLAFFRCLFPQDIAGRKVSAEEQYLIQDLWMHFGNKARMENDRASVRRDRNEGNLNSLDFPEFTRWVDRDDIKVAVAQLTRIIEYEKKCCKLGFEALAALEDGKKKNSQIEALRFYYFLVDIYNDVYVLKDISSERK